MITAAWVCLFSPLATAVLITLGGRHMSRRASGYVSTLSVAVSFVAAAIAFLSIRGDPADEQSHLSTSWTWLAAGDFNVGLTLLVDPLSIFMMLIVSGVGALIVG
jgi:NADH-quinone oxidoreductase subunit L